MEKEIKCDREEFKRRVEAVDLSRVDPFLRDEAEQVLYGHRSGSFCSDFYDAAVNNGALRYFLKD